MYPKMSPQTSAPDTSGKSLGRGSISKILIMEQQRLKEQAAEEMREQLTPPAVNAPLAPFDSKHTYQPSKQPERVREGLSRFSRFVGEDLSEFAGIVVHTPDTVMAAQNWPVHSYYLEIGSNNIPFSLERQLLLAICRLTVGYESFSCQITLDALSVASGIRNSKTLRKWLTDLQKRNYIRYIPIHGDLRGSIVQLTPPDEIRGSIERNWRNSRQKI
jgi:hypothetical protein